MFLGFGWSVCQRGTNPLQLFSEFLKGLFRSPWYTHIHTHTHTYTHIHTYTYTSHTQGRQRLPRLFQFGVLAAFGAFPAPLLNFITTYLRTHPKQLFFAYCDIPPSANASSSSTSPDGVATPTSHSKAYPGTPVTLVLTSTHLILLSLRPSLRVRPSRLVLHRQVPLMAVRQVQVRARSQLLRLDLRPEGRTGCTTSLEMACPQSPKFIDAVATQVGLVRAGAGRGAKVPPLPIQSRAPNS